MDIHTLPHWSFGDNPQMADELVQLVLSGKKTATCTALAWHLAEPLPPVGSLQVITDGQNVPACVIQNTAQFIIRFDEVDETLAKKEGEGDLSLAYWRTVHQEFFEKFGVFDDKMWWGVLNTWNILSTDPNGINNCIFASKMVKS